MSIELSGYRDDKLPSEDKSYFSLSANEKIDADEKFVEEEPLPTENLTLLPGPFTSTLEKGSEKLYRVTVRDARGEVLTKGLFDKKKVAAGQTQERPFYHGGVIYTLRFRLQDKTTQLFVAEVTQLVQVQVRGLPDDLTASYDPKKRSVNLFRSRDTYRSIPLEGNKLQKKQIDGTLYTISFLVIGSTIQLTGTKNSNEPPPQDPSQNAQENEPIAGAGITQLLGIEQLPLQSVEFVLEKGKVIWRDRSTKEEKGSLLPTQYKPYEQVTRSLYTYDSLLYDATGPYTLQLLFYGSGRAKLLVEKFVGGVVGVQKDISDKTKDNQFSGITTSRHPGSDRKKGSIDLQKGEKVLGKIDFAGFSLSQKKQLAQREPVSETAKESLRCIIQLSGKPVFCTLTNKQGVVGVDLSTLESGASPVTVVERVKCGKNTAGTRKAVGVYTDKQILSEIQLSRVGQAGLNFTLSKNLPSKIGEVYTVDKQKLQDNNDYSIRYVNSGGKIEVTLKQLNGFADGGLPQDREKNNEPLPALNKTPNSTTPAPEEVTYSGDKYPGQENFDKLLLPTKRLICMRYLTEILGYQTRISAGIVGNIQKESEFKSNAKGDGNTSYGLCQRHDDPKNIKNRRRTALKNYTAKYGDGNPEYITQLNFIKYELDGTYTAAREAMKQTKNEKQAAASFCENYENPTNCELLIRESFASDALLQYGIWKQNK